MWETSSDEKFREETHKLIAEAHIHKFGVFLEQFNDSVNTQKNRLKNNFNITTNFVTVNENPYECISESQLIYSSNPILSKILVSLSVICKEFVLLSREASKYYKCLIFYGEDNVNSYHNIQLISTVIDDLQQIHCYVIRIQEVVVLLIQQVTAILTRGFYVTNNYCSFPEVFNCFSEALVCLLSLDQLLNSHLVKKHCFLYKRTLRYVMRNSSMCDFKLDQMKILDSQLSLLENNLLSGNIFKDTVEKCLNDEMAVQIKKCSLYSEFVHFLNSLIYELERDEENTLFTQILLQINALMVFTFKLFNSSDRKVSKKVVDLNKKGSACTLFGNILWYPEQFILKHLPYFVKFIDEKNIENNRVLQINTRTQNLQKESAVLCSQAIFWMTEIKKISTQNMKQFNVKHLQDICSLLIDALKFAKKINSLVKWIMNLNLDKGLSITKSSLLSLCKLIEVLKMTLLTFNNNACTFLYVIMLISQHLGHKALTLLYNLKKQYSNEKLHKQHKLDILAALNVCEKILQGPSTNQRLLLANLSLSASGISGDIISEIRSVLSRLRLISNFSNILQKSCDCSFLYWHTSYILPVYFSKLINTKSDLSQYYLLLNALTDCALLIDNKEVECPVDIMIKKNLLAPITQIVETNLRLQTHIHLQLPSTDPIKNNYSYNFFKYSPAPLNANYKNIKNETEHYLSMMFYNLTAVVLHNWKTYGEMRRLAYFQYGLDTVDDNLPMQTLEQGLDVLEIMRNINVFVNKYLYNLNSQIFIEETSSNKHLNSINISHVANSIRTHGIGIMNTTVNFTYQFLRDKFYIFSQFMFDEHIKSRLLKDLRFFSEHKLELNQMYPYERADKFNFGIRKLGLNEHGESYLDLFRKVITQIGNAMGYIRLIRSGGRRCLADSVCFIPDLKDIETVNNLLKEGDLSVLSKSAANCLIYDLENFIENFEDATEYFKLLVNVFVPVLRNKNNIHLKNFYAIIPPLTINFIEHSLTCKERLNKKNKADSAFTDDGFALGLAYIIELLDQDSQLKSLHWFQSVQKKFSIERLNIKEQKSVTNSDDEKLKQTLALTEKRISTFEREFQLLRYGFTSARLFFQS